MHLLFKSNVIQHSSFQNKIVSTCYSPDSKILAVATASGEVSIYDNEGQRLDSFVAKAGNGENSVRNFLIKGMEFCPDTEMTTPKLAVAQTDHVVHVYKYHTPKDCSDDDERISCIWDGKKTICNKFLETSPVLCLVWPKVVVSGKRQQLSSSIVYGLADGRVMIGSLRSNQSQLLYNINNSAVIAIAAKSKTGYIGNSIISSHYDGSIVLFSCQDVAKNTSSFREAKIIYRTMLPTYALSWGKSICLGDDSNQRVLFLDKTGSQVASYKYERDGSGKDGRKQIAAIARFCQDGNVVIFSTYSQLNIFCWEDCKWNESKKVSIQNTYGISSVCWKQNGSSFAVGFSSGLLDTYEYFLKRSLSSHGFETTYVSTNLVSIKHISSGEHCLIKTSTNSTILKINFHRNSFSGKTWYITLKTDESIICKSMLGTENVTTSISWKRGSNADEEKYIFDIPNAFLVCQGGEITVVEHGQNVPLGVIKSEYLLPSLLSIRMERNLHTDKFQKLIAYLIDKQTIRVENLLSKASQVVNHNCDINFVELNSFGNLLLYRDKNLRLFIVDQTRNQSASLLMEHCSYAQWVPDSDAVVAQNNTYGDMYVWYNPRNPDEVICREISGEIERIERKNGKTFVFADDMSCYEIVEELINFNNAVVNKKYAVALEILKGMKMSAQTESMWLQLQYSSIEDANFPIAIYCSATLGNICLCDYLNRIHNKLMKFSDPSKRARYDLLVEESVLKLKSNTDEAERILLNLNCHLDAIAMYEKLFMFENALLVSRATEKESEVLSRQQKYIEFLIKRAEFDTIFKLSASDGEPAELLELLVDSGMFVQAFKFVVSQNIKLHVSTSMIENIANKLHQFGLYECAGDLYLLKLDKIEDAIESYVRGFYFKKAVEVAKKYKPAEVCKYQRQWGNYLSSKGYFDEALSHYKNVNDTTMAMDVALKSKNIEVAKSLILSPLSVNLNCKSYSKSLVTLLIQHHRYQEAETILLKNGFVDDVVDMLIDCYDFQRAYLIGRRHEDILNGKLDDILISHAHLQEESGLIYEAEESLMSIEQYHRTYEMFLRHRKFDSAFSLILKVNELKEKGCFETLILSLASEGDFALIEKCCQRYGYITSNCIELLIQNDFVEEAFQFSLHYHGESDGTSMFVKQLYNNEGPLKLQHLNELGLIGEVIDFLEKKFNFNEALEIATRFMPSRLNALKEKQRDQDLVHADQK